MSFQLKSRDGIAALAMVTFKNVINAAAKAGQKGKRVHGAPPVVSFQTSEEDQELRHEGVDVLVQLANGQWLPCQIWSNTDGLGHFERTKPRSRKYGPIVAVFVNAHMAYRKAKRFILKQIAQKANSIDRVRQTLKHINRAKDGLQKSLFRKGDQRDNSFRRNHRRMCPAWA